jgi:hypothetical protein
MIIDIYDKYDIVCNMKILRVYIEFTFVLMAIGVFTAALTGSPSNDVIALLWQVSALGGAIYLYKKKK